MRAVLYYLAATRPLDPGVTISVDEPIFDVSVVDNHRDARIPYRGLMGMTLHVDAVRHADERMRAGGWQMIDLADYDNEQLGAIIRGHLSDLVVAGATRATVVLGLTGA